jgi:hypothetical protein
MPSRATPRKSSACAWGGRRPEARRSFTPPARTGSYFWQMLYLCRRYAAGNHRREYRGLTSTATNIPALRASKQQMHRNITQRSYPFCVNDVKQFTVTVAAQSFPAKFAGTTNEPSDVTVGGANAGTNTTQLGSRGTRRPRRKQRGNPGHGKERDASRIACVSTGAGVLGKTFPNDFAQINR